MSITYGVYEWVFDLERLSEMLHALPDGDFAAAAELLGMEKNSLRGWRDNLKEREFPHPSMSNFLLFCNLMDCNPADFFIVKKAV